MFWVPYNRGANFVADLMEIENFFVLVWDRNEIKAFSGLVDDVKIYCKSFGGFRKQNPFSFSQVYQFNFKFLTVESQVFSN